QRQRRLPRRDVVVVLGAVDEVAPHADLEHLRRELGAWPRPIDPPVVADERGLVRPFLPGEGFDVERAGGLLLLVDGRGVLGARGGGHGQEHRNGQGTEHVTSRWAPVRAGRSGSLAAGYAGPVPV